MIKNILAIQMKSVIGDFDANKTKIQNALLSFFNLNKNKKIDILFLPEVWTVGWYTDCFKENADKENQTVNFLSDIAKEYDINVVGGSYIREVDGVLKNSSPVINRQGKLLCHYDKIHLYSPDGEAKVVTPGNTPVVVDIEGLKIGLSICYDIRFPELFRAYSASNFLPDILVNMSAWPLSRKMQYEYMAASRAIENQSYFLALTQSGLIKNDIYNAGNSVLFGPMGDKLAFLDNEEGFIHFEINTDETDEIRRMYPNLQNRKVDDFGFFPKFYNTDKVV